MATALDVAAILNCAGSVEAEGFMGVGGGGVEGMFSKSCVQSLVTHPEVYLAAP